MLPVGSNAKPQCGFDCQGTTFL